ncbi:MAG: ATP-binding cassette domain-containing protein, partial [Microthrixaceae bacterium]
MTSLFEFHDVTVRIDSVDVLQNVSLAIPDSKLTVIAGASGSGKSTLLRCCNRLDAPSSGSLQYLGEEVDSLDPLQHRRSVGMVFQQPVTFPGSVFENLRAALPDLSQERAVQLCIRLALNI